MSADVSLTSTTNNKSMQRDNKLNLVIPSMTEGGHIHQIFLAIRLIPNYKAAAKDRIYEKNIFFTDSMPLLPSNNSAMACGGPKTLASTTILRKFGKNE